MECPDWPPGAELFVIFDTIPRICLRCKLPVDCVFQQPVQAAVIEWIIEIFKGGAYHLYAMNMVFACSHKFMRRHIDVHDTIPTVVMVEIEIESVFRGTAHSVKFFKNHIDRLKLFWLFHFCLFLNCAGARCPASYFHLLFAAWNQVIDDCCFEV